MSGGVPARNTNPETNDRQYKSQWAVLGGMSGTDPSNVALDAATLERLVDVLAANGVSFALVFGSAARDTPLTGDIDIAVEFDELRPEDEGYASATLRLRSALDTALDENVDMVDVHSLSPRFARVVFDQGVPVLGYRERMEELAARLAGDEPTVGEARRRVSAAADRLQENAS